MTSCKYDITRGDYARGGLASRRLKEQLKRIGASPEDIRRAMIAAYEAEMNVVIHSVGGRMVVRLDQGLLEVDVIDEGPGIADVAQAMREGFSTAPAEARELGFGAGMGLPNIRKNTDRFVIESSAGRGTCLRFSIHLRVGQTAGMQQGCSLEVVAGRCNQCLHCLRACPMRAIRVRNGQPSILRHLCIDCTNCIAACPPGALAVGKVAVKWTDLAGSGDDVSRTTLVVPPAMLAQFGAGYGAKDVLAVLREMGWKNVVHWQGALDSLSSAVLKLASESESQGVSRPVISPCCPAVIELIQTRFASLLPNIAPYASPMEAMADRVTRANAHESGATFVILCPAQQAALGDVKGQLRTALPSALHNEVAAKLHAGERCAENVLACSSCDEAKGEILRVTGISHVAKILEEVEDGLVTDVNVLELWACDEGCFGSLLLCENPHVARRRWAAQPAQMSSPACEAIARPKPLQARGGVRLDEDMAKAIVKFRTIDTIRFSLPGNDCGICGSPSCACLAEDVVMGRVDISCCPRRPDTVNR